MFSNRFRSAVVSSLFGRSVFLYAQPRLDGYVVTTGRGFADPASNWRAGCVFYPAVKGAGIPSIRPHHLGARHLKAGG